jgi:hypothetical protein
VVTSKVFGYHSKEIIKEVEKNSVAKCSEENGIYTGRNV